MAGGRAETALVPEGTLMAEKDTVRLDAGTYSQNGKMEITSLKSPKAMMSVDIEEYYGMKDRINDLRAANKMLRKENDRLKETIKTYRLMTMPL